jgi:hypothetical protein
LVIDDTGVAILIGLFNIRSELFLFLDNIFGFDSILFLVSFTFSLSSSLDFAGGRSGYSKNDYRSNYM